MIKSAQLGHFHLGCTPFVTCCLKKIYIGYLSLFEKIVLALFSYEKICRNVRGVLTFEMLNIYTGMCQFSLIKISRSLRGLQPLEKISFFICFSFDAFSSWCLVLAPTPLDIVFFFIFSTEIWVGGFFKLI